MHAWFCWGDLSERDHLEDLGIDGKNIEMFLQEVGWRSMDWTGVFRDRDGFGALVNTVINLGVHKMQGVS